MKRFLLRIPILFTLGALAVAQSLTAADREKAIQYLEQTRSGVIAATKGLSDAQMKFKSAPDRWSIAETLEHIMAAGRQPDKPTSPPKIWATNTCDACLSSDSYNLPKPMTTATYSEIGIRTSRAITVFNSTNLSMAARPSDSDAALARKRALLKLENSVARITATTVNGINSSRAIYRSIIFKNCSPPVPYRLASGRW